MQVPRVNSKMSEKQEINTEKEDLVAKKKQNINYVAAQLMDY